MTANAEMVGTGIEHFPPSVAFMVSRLGFEVSSQLAAGLAPLEIAPRDFGLLRALARTEGETQRSVGKALNIPPSRMVTLLDGLEKRGLVRRRRHPTDRRAHALHLTAAGQKLLNDAVDVAVRVEVSLCAGLEPAEREQLLGLLGRLTQPSGVKPGVHPGLSAAGEW